MTFSALEIPGVFQVDVEPRRDERGSFARLFSQKEFQAQGLESRLSEISISSNTRRGTLRGMHFQRDPHGEIKLVRVVRGAIFDVVVDLRRNSPTFCNWHGAELSCDNGHALYIPRGCAHGFLTLTDKTDVLYQITDTFDSASASGYAWNDPAFAIEWPFRPQVISERDLSWPAFH